HHGVDQPELGDRRIAEGDRDAEDGGEMSHGRLEIASGDDHLAEAPGRRSAGCAGAVNGPSGRPESQAGVPGDAWEDRVASEEDRVTVDRALRDVRVRGGDRDTFRTQEP